MYVCSFEQFTQNLFLYSKSRIQIQIQIKSGMTVAVQLRKIAPRTMLIKRNSHINHLGC